MCVVVGCASCALQFISKSFLPLLLEPVLGDYSRNVPAARNAEVLSVTIALVNKLKGEFAPHVTQIMDSVVRFTLEMISPNYQDHPDHRMLLFKLLQELVVSLPALDPVTIKVVVDAVIFGLKHQQRDVAEPVGQALLGLCCVCTLLCPGLSHCVTASCCS